ncbi:MAG TPA: glycosyltransferase family 4 protein [Candidatus Acidoferrales bacterium]|nr:glycosyltransferase family 4 protein [Candidatus Acidoferrales bacterium]
MIATDVPRQREAGTAGVVFSHAQELQKRGHDVECWFLEEMMDSDAWPKRLVTLRFAFLVARRIMKTPAKYDVVNLHGATGCVYGTWRKLRREGTPPYVFTMHGLIERYAYVMRREHRKGRAWNFAWKNRMWHRAYHQGIFSWAIRMADYGVSCSREGWTYPELVRDRDPNRLWYVPNGVEKAFFQKREYTERIPVRLLYVGTWLDRKGIYYLADAFRALLLKSIPVELTVAGCGGSEQTVRDFFAPEVRGHVHVFPFVKREEMPGVYAEHDVFVFASLMEGLPLSLLEAMAAGMPVVTTYNSGMADVVEDGFNGLTVLTAHTESLVEAIERLCGSVELRKQLGQEAARTMQRYTWERVTERLEKVFALAVRQEARP